MDSLRGIAVTMEALGRLGVERPQDHIAVLAVHSPFFFNRGMCYVLVKRSRLTAEEVARSREFAARMRFDVVWLPGGQADLAQDPAGERPVYQVARQIITSSDRAPLYREAPIDILPSTDDQPFYFVERGGANRAPGKGLALLWTCFGLLSGLLVVFVGLPLMGLARSRRVPHRSCVWFLLYSSLLGSAFMLVEMELFHVFGLLLGSPVHALVSVLVGLLVFSGLGSACASRYFEWPRNAIAFGGLLASLLLFVMLRGPILSLLLPLPLWVRVAATLALVAPLGFQMGLPMPLGMHAIGHEPDWMTWGWALNGAFAVLSSVGAVLLAIHLGISASFGVGLLCYGAAWALFYRLAALPDGRIEAQPAGDPEQAQVVVRRPQSPGDDGRQRVLRRDLGAPTS